MIKKSEKSNIEIPIICNLPEPTLKQRREVLIQEVFSQALEVRELLDGYELCFPAEESWTAKLVDLIQFERQCCPFLTFGLIFLPNRGPIWLQIRGGEGLKDFLRNELGALAN